MTNRVTPYDLRADQLVPKRGGGNRGARAVSWLYIPRVPLGIALGIPQVSGTDCLSAYLHECSVEYPSEGGPADFPTGNPWANTRWGAWATILDAMSSDLPGYQSSRGLPGASFGGWGQAGWAVPEGGRDEGGNGVPRRDRGLAALETFL